MVKAFSSHLDFTTRQYTLLLDTLKKCGYSFLSFSEFAGLQVRLNSPHVLLRHDVDRMPRRSLAIARIEEEAGIQSTFFFRTCRCSFDPGIISEISAMGHEIGYHYETLSSCRGAYCQALDLFELDLKKFDIYGGVRSIAMHGRPLSKWDNRDLWKEYDYSDYGVTSEAYLDIDWEQYLYFTDTGRSWNSQSNIRDKVSTTCQSSNIKITPQLIQKILKDKPNLVISTHPERWTSEMLGWTQVFVSDSALNMIKKVIKLLR